MEKISKEYDQILVQFDSPCYRKLYDPKDIECDLTTDYASVFDRKTHTFLLHVPREELHFIELIKNQSAKEAIVNYVSEKTAEEMKCSECPLQKICIYEGSVLGRRHSCKETWKAFMDGKVSKMRKEKRK